MIAGDQRAVKPRSMNAAVRVSEEKTRIPAKVAPLVVTGGCSDAQGQVNTLFVSNNGNL